jgi:RNA polymerase sigma-70 factor (ECF subfamily)
LEREWIDAADRERGRFRSFLLASLRHFLANEWNRARAQKRGGNCQIVSLDLRARYRELLRDEIAQTVSDASDVEDELRNLFAALSC